MKHMLPVYETVSQAAPHLFGSVSGGETGERMGAGG